MMKTELANYLNAEAEKTKAEQRAERAERAKIQHAELLAALKGCLTDVRIVVDHNRKPGNKRTASEAVLVGMEYHIEQARAAIANAEAE